MDPKTVEDVIMDFEGRRLGLIKALTTDVEEFYQLCDPKTPNLCLYGHPNQEWGVNLPPSLDLPEPRLGINFLRSGMEKDDWLYMVALHSDAWLHAIVGFLAAKLKFDKQDRNHLFSKIVDFSSIFEVTSSDLNSKRIMMEDAGIPHEIFIDILSRISVKDLIRYRCVSKTWCSLIDDTDFFRAHLNNCKANLEGTHLLVFKIPISYYENRKILICRNDTFRKVAKLKCLDHDKHYKRLSYVNGLMLLRCCKEILLWNPSINLSLCLPKFDLERQSVFELGLGFDASHNDYKVIAVVYPEAQRTHMYNLGRTKRRYHTTVPGLVKLFSLRSNSWSCCVGVEPPPIWSVGRQVFVNGAIHWTNLGTGPSAYNALIDETADSHVVSFDLTNKVFNYFKLPTYDNEERCVKSILTVLDGSLAIFRHCRLHKYANDIFVMKEYGVEESWCKLYSFTLVIKKFLCFKSTGELLFVNQAYGVQSYDVKRKTTRQLAKNNIKSLRYKIYNHVESLVLFGR